MIYDEFSLRFECGESLKARVISASGEATAEVQAPKLKRLAEEMAPEGELRSWRDAVLESATVTPQEIGRELFEGIFIDSIKEAFHREIGRIDGIPGARLRLRLGFSPRDPELRFLEDLPWEMLFSPSLDAFLALDRRFSIVRSLPVLRSIRPARRCLDISCLGVGSSPRGMTPLDIAAEKQGIERSLRGMQRVRFKMLPTAIEGDLRDQLLDGKFQVLHFMGHGYRQKQEGRAVFGLVLENDYREPVRVDSRGWSELVADTELRLVVLNACRSAQQANDHRTEPFHGVAQHLIRSGLPAVLAMRQPISDQAAINFSRQIFRRLAHGDPIDAALVEARKELKRSGESWPEWATPALFLRGAGEKLFRFERKVKKRPEEETTKSRSSAHPRSMVGLNIGQLRSKKASFHAEQAVNIDQADVGEFDLRVIENQERGKNNES